jgi:hypothetical protein
MVYNTWNYWGEGGPYPLSGILKTNNDDQQNKALFSLASDSEKLNLNLSKHVLTDFDEAVLMKGFKFSVMNPHSYLDLVFAVESVVLKLPRTLGMEFRWKIRAMLEKSRYSMSIMLQRR